MCQNLTDSCNDYRQQTANTGIMKISTADSSLTGGGAATVFSVPTGYSSEIRSIIIKAIQPTLQGMVRLFINNGSISTLYKEVPIPVQPQAASVPVPTPQYIMYEIKLDGGLKLNEGYSILASTQNAQTFNIIVEGSNWTYPGELPSVCCNFMQETANVGLNSVTTANPALDGSGTPPPASVFTANAGTAGSMVNAITIKAMGSTHEGAVRIFISPDGSNWYLMQEVYVPQTTQSAFEPSFKAVINPNFFLQASYQLGVTIQNSEPFAITVEGVDLVFPE